MEINQIKFYNLKGHTINDITFSNKETNDNIITNNESYYWNKDNTIDIEL